MSMPPDQPYGLDVTRSARERCDLPGIFLIVVGTLNLLMALFTVFRGLQVSMMPTTELELQLRQAQEMFPALFQGQAMPSAEDLKGQLVGSFVGGGIVEVLAALVTIVGGAKMRQLKAHALAVVGSVLALLPCVSCSACCGLGEVVGIWALVVLLNPEVRAAFEGIPPGWGGYGPPGTQPPGGYYPPPPGSQYPPPPGGSSPPQGGNPPAGGYYYPPPGQPPQAPPQAPPGPPNEPPPPPAGS
jgi:hypothetical protein